MNPEDEKEILDALERDEIDLEEPNVALLSDLRIATENTFKKDMSKDPSAGRGWTNIE